MQCRRSGAEAQKIFRRQIRLSGGIDGVLDGRGVSSAQVHYAGEIAGVASALRSRRRVGPAEDQAQRFGESKLAAHLHSCGLQSASNRNPEGEVRLNGCKGPGINDPGPRGRVRRVAEKLNSLIETNDRGEKIAEAGFFNNFLGGELPKTNDPVK